MEGEFPRDPYVCATVHDNSAYVEFHATSFQSAPAGSTRISPLTLRFRGRALRYPATPYHGLLRTPCKASPRRFLKPFGKSLARLSYKNEQFAFWYPDLNPLLRCLESGSIGNVFTRDEERLGQLLLMSFRTLQ
jgi:hypothetical protein